MEFGINCPVCGKQHSAILPTELKKELFLHMLAHGKANLARCYVEQTFGALLYEKKEGEIK